jgi:DNA-binding NarL/FixJ family response regulator
MPSVVIADDHEITRSGVRYIIDSFPDLSIAAEAGDGIEAIAMVKRHKPDLMLLDVSMPHAGALEITVEAKRWNPDTRIIIFTGVDSPALLKELINSDVHAIVMKSDEASILKQSIQSVLDGKKFISPEILTVLEESERSERLSSREKQILMLISNGKNNKEIANLLSLSAKTVENHRSNIMKKLGLHSVSEIMAYAYKQGLLTK